MTTFRPDHLHLRSADPDAAARFYVEMFGATQAGRAETGGGLRVVLDLGGLPLFIERVAAGTPAPPPPPFLGLEHLGLVVDDLDAAVAGLRARGATFTMQPNSPRPGIRICFVQAPDGARVEVLERASA